MNYPDSFIRGIPNLQFMEEGFPNAQLFNKFDENPDREDNYNEISINWYDDEGALSTIFNQKKKGTEEYQFKIGGAIMSRIELDRLKKKPQIIGKLSYERREVEGNKYHGNILLRKDTTKGVKNLIASSLALCVERVELRDKEDTLNVEKKEATTEVNE